MNLTRRKVIKSLTYASLGSLAVQVLPAVGSPPEPLYGINAFYLLTESYRKVKRNPQGDIRGIILNYLQNELGLANLREKSKINAIRFLAGNNYPPGENRGFANPFQFDAILWNQANQMDQLVLEILTVLTQSLSELGFYLVPVLTNYWMAYGGILRYLEWVNRIKSEEWFDAFCNMKDADYYMKYGLDFYLIPEIEKLFQSHITPVVNFLQKNSKVTIVDVMNEPRGKNLYSIQNQPIGNLYSHQIVAQWLNRQAIFLRERLPANVSISTGEEGWLVAPVELLLLDYLKTEGQYYEGIDLRTNLWMNGSAFTMGGIHMYPHEGVELKKVNTCGQPFTDRRGWDYLLQPNKPQLRESYLKMAEEWLKSRAAVFANKPWYVGEMGWCWSQSPADRSPLPATVLQAERIRIYRSWAEQAFSLGARGVFLWELGGLEHRDEFYGLSGAQVIEIFPK